MITSIPQFAARLNELDPERDEFVIQVDDLVEETQEELHNQLYESIFNFFESCPDSDCGAPGTLVHLVETYYPNYVELLCQSIERQPSVNTVLMLHRILNSTLSEQERTKYMNLLAVAGGSSGEAARQAEHFYAYQNEK